MNFKTWINTLRIEEAKRLLHEDPNSKYIYIANLCGYPDLPTFSKVFRSIEGMTPHDYRQHIIQQNDVAEPQEKPFCQNM